jgi:RNA polymerase sigma factor (sigma-70 family)
MLNNMLRARFDSSNSCDQNAPGSDEKEFRAARSGAFTSTHWSLVAQAGSDSEQAKVALETLCGKYWYPIYAFIRQRGSNHHEAEDLTQAFFAHLLHKQLIGKANRNKGKFRTFLLAALGNFLTNEWDKQSAIKRGGGRQIISLDETVAEGRYREEPTVALTPEKLFERHWAFALLEQALNRLKQEHNRPDKVELFTKLESGLTGAPSKDWFAQCAQELKMSENALRVALHRMRRRFGDIVREEVSCTAASEADVDDEIRHLFAAISN